jgi:anti-anti-sigma regulatory factor
MSHDDLEQECKALRARVAELESLRAAETRMAQVLRVLLEHLDMVVWAIDEEGTFTLQDGKALGQAGLQRSHFVGQNMFAVYPADSVVGIRNALSGTAGHDFTEAHGITWENWHIPLRDTEGSEVTGVVGLSLNVTDAVRTKAELTAKLALIERQQEVIQNLETPVIQVWDHVLTLPMVGIVDSRRAARVTDDLLSAVSRTQARFAILDLTGVDVVDTSTAAHMLNIINAVRLLGAEGIITGIRPIVAQTMISLGLDLSHVKTLATLRDGLAFAIRSLGERLVPSNHRQAPGAFP